MNQHRSIVLLSVFVLGFIKTLIFTPTYVDAATLLVLGFVFAYSEYKNHDSKLKELEEKLDFQGKELKVLKENVSSIKVVQQIKPNAIQFK